MQLKSTVEEGLSSFSDSGVIPPKAQTNFLATPYRIRHLPLSFDEVRHFHLSTPLRLEKHQDKGKAVITLEAAVPEGNISPSLRVHGSKQPMSAGFLPAGCQRY
jgi:hypothetical protein